MQEFVYNQFATIFGSGLIEKTSDFINMVVGALNTLFPLNGTGIMNTACTLYNLSITPLTSFKPEDSFTEKEKRTLCCYAKECGWEITLPQNHRYTYCIVDRIDFTEEWEYILTEITPPFKNLNKKLMNRFQQYIVDLFTKFCAELEAAGYHFFYSIDDEAIKNVCDINEWMFLEDGTLFSA